jgi:enterobactin synthetase component D
MLGVSMKLRPELLALFPAGVVGAELLCLEEAEELRAEERESLRGAAPRRLREFAAGRHCAREALAGLGLAGVAVPRRADRRPAWPAGVVGSISHSGGYCAAVVARRSGCSGLGFDAERWGRVTPALWRRIATAPEVAWLRGLGGDADRAATLLFSAKEAFYKAQYARSERFVGFADAAFHPGGDGGFEIELLVEVPGLGSPGERFPGRATGCAERCYAGVYLR